MAAALADVLIDFGTRARLAPAPAPEPHAQVIETPLPPQIDVEAQIADAVLKAEAEVAARFTQEMELRLKEADEAHQAELQQLRGELGAQFGARVSAEMAALEEKTVTAAARVAARILGQLATESVSERAVAALATTIMDAIGDNETIRIRVKGPQSLFEPFAAAMGEHSRHLEFVETASVDLTVSIDESLFETRIGEWSAVLAENLG